MSRSLKNNKS